MWRQSHPGLLGSCKRWKTGLGESQLVYTYLKCPPSISVRIISVVAHLSPVSWFVPLRSSLLVMERERKDFPVPCLFLHVCSRSCPSLSSRWGRWGRETAGTSSCRCLEPPNLLLLTAWSNKLHLSPAGSVTLGVSWPTQLGSFLLPGKVQRHHTACSPYPQEPLRYAELDPQSVQGIRQKKAENSILCCLFLAIAK